MLGLVIDSTMLHWFVRMNRLAIFGGLDPDCHRRRCPALLWEVAASVVASPSSDYLSLLISKTTPTGGGLHLSQTSKWEDLVVDLEESWLVASAKIAHLFGEAEKLRSYRIVLLESLVSSRTCEADYLLNRWTSNIFSQSVYELDTYRTSVNILA